MQIVHHSDTNAQLLDAVGTLDVGFALWSADLRFLMSNATYRKIVCRNGDVDHEVGTAFRDLVPAYFSTDQNEGDDTAASMEAWFKSLVGSRELSFDDGRIIELTPKRTEQGNYLLSVSAVDVEKHAEARAHDMLYDAFQALDEGMVLCDQNMRYLFGNDAWKNMMFTSHKHLLPEPGDSVVESVLKHFEAGFYAIPDGMSKEEYIDWFMTQLSGHKKVRFSSAAGRHFIGSSHLTAFGGWLLFQRDVTEQITAREDLERQRELTHQNEKLSALGELLASVAHELNNPLSVVFGYSQMLKGKISDPVAAERIDLVCQSAERAAKIVRTFLAMARQRPMKVAHWPINDIVSTALEVLSYSLKSNGTQIDVDLSQDDLTVEGDFDQLAQVFSNLIVNAGHAVEAKGNEGWLNVRSYREAGTERVIVEIADNGPGIPEDLQSRIFEPFFTTKDVGEGTGIGLAFSHRIIESHQGQLSLDSTPGRGTRFFVQLDAADHHPQPESPVEMATVRATGTILVLDDEVGVVKLVGDLLADEGFTVRTSHDPHDALEILKTHRFDAILSDFKMPGMNGEAFYNALNVAAPEMANRTAFITGDAMSQNVRDFLQNSGRPYIEKPILREELLALVTDVVSAGYAK